MNSLREARKRVDDLLVCDQTPDGKGHTLVARFIAAELVLVPRADLCGNIGKGGWTDIRLDVEPQR